MHLTMKSFKPQPWFYFNFNYITLIIIFLSYIHFLKTHTICSTFFQTGIHSMEECFNDTLEKNFWYLCLLFLNAGRFSFFSGWFFRLRKVSSTEKKCSSTKLDLYYQGAFSMAKMEPCTTSLWGRTHTQFHNTSMSNKSIVLCKIPLEKYYYECSSKIFLIKFIKSTAGA